MRKYNLILPTFLEIHIQSLPININEYLIKRKILEHFCSCGSLEKELQCSSAEVFTRSCSRSPWLFASSPQFSASSSSSGRSSRLRRTSRTLMSGSRRPATSRRTSWVICLVKCFAGIGVQQTEIWWSDVLWVNDLLAWFFETGTAKTIKLFIGHYPGLGIKYFINLGWSILRGWVIFDTRMRMNRTEYVSLTPEVLMMNVHWRSVSLSAEVAKFWRRQDERAASAKIREAGLREEVWGRRISFIIRTESGLTDVQPQAGVNTLQSHNHAIANWQKKSIQFFIIICLRKYSLVLPDWPGAAAPAAGTRWRWCTRWGLARLSALWGEF